MNISKKIIRLWSFRSSESLIKMYRKKGLKIGNNCVFRRPNSVNIDTTRPSLIEIGDNVDMNQNFTIMTHDYSSHVFLAVFKDFVNSSGRVKIGNNVYFGVNCTILKGVAIGDNCIIGANSLVTKSIPSNSVVVGAPAKVISSLDVYYKKRKEECLHEAFEYIKSIRERFNRDPLQSELFEEFPFFVDGSVADSHPIVKIIKAQLGDAYPEWQISNKATFQDEREFIKQAYNS